jgi:gas vesicle protein
MSAADISSLLGGGGIGVVGVLAIMVTMLVSGRLRRQDEVTDLKAEVKDLKEIIKEKDRAIIAQTERADASVKTWERLADALVSSGPRRGRA